VDRPSWAPTDVDINQPSIARVYDYFLGGSHNFAADREFGERMIATVPRTTWVVKQNRDFLGRAVRFLAEQGIDQFLDIGSGIPTVGNVHEVAAAVLTAPRVAYVDNDPVAIAHSRAILADVPNATIIGADLLDVRDLLGRPELRSALDFDRPVGILLAAVLHFILDDDAARTIVRELTAAVPPGSYLAISHATNEAQQDEAQQVQSLYNRQVARLALRPRDDIVALFDGVELVEPGVVPAPLWRPDGEVESAPDPNSYPGYVGVARIG
jgi:hypothetical protein